MSYEVFRVEYEKQLRKAHQEYPQEYRYPIERVPEIAAMMTAGFLDGAANKDSPTVRATCKELGIKFTYKAIQEFLQ